MNVPARVPAGLAGAAPAFVEQPGPFHQHVLQRRVDRPLSRGPLVEDLHRRLRPAQNLVCRGESLEMTGMRVNQLAVVEIQPALMVRCRYDDEAALALHLEQLQESEERDPADATDRLRVEHPL